MTSVLAYKAHPDHIQQVEAARNDHIAKVRSELVKIFGPVRDAIANASEPRAAAHHAIAVMKSQKDAMVLTIGHAYEQVAAALSQHTLDDLAKKTGQSVDTTSDSYTLAFNNRVDKYIRDQLVTYCDRVIESFARQALNIVAEAKETPVPVLEPRRGTYYARGYRGLRQRKDDSSSVASSETSDATDDETDTSTLDEGVEELDLLDSLIDGVLDVTSEMVSVEAGNLGMFASAGAYSDETGIGLVKVWQALQDDRTRESHSEADGQQRDFEEPFDVGDSQLQFPLDESLGASIGEIIYCRCVVVFEPAETMARRRAPVEWTDRMLRIMHDHMFGGRDG